MKSKTGKTVLLNSYSLLQDRFFEHMRAAGFDGFERGERGSTAEHLSVLDYKIQQDKKRLDEISEQKEKSQKEIDTLVQATKVRAGILATQEEINAMAKPGKSGKTMYVSNSDWGRVSDMAKRCILLDEKMKDAQKQIDTLRLDRDKWKHNYERLWDEVKDFIQAIRRFPSRLLDFIREHLLQPKNKEVSR